MSLLAAYMLEATATDLLETIERVDWYRKSLSGADCRRYPSGLSGRVAYSAFPVQP